jgi:serpin B
MKTRFLILALILLALPIAPASAEQATTATDQAEVVQGNNAFAIELYQQLKNQPGNLFFSPASISTALAMTYAGARGETAAEMAKVLHFSLPPDRLHPAMGAILRYLNTTHDGYQLHVANALWGQQGYAFLDDFLKLTKDNYGAGFKTVDFKGATEHSRQIINQWVEQQTEQGIRELLQPGILTKDTRLVLTNAVYFKGDWATRFRTEDTKEEDFHLWRPPAVMVAPVMLAPYDLLLTPPISNGSQRTQFNLLSVELTIKVLMMHLTGEFNYFDGGSFQALELPYKNNQLSMIVFLPKDAFGLPIFEQSVSAVHLTQWLGSLRKKHRVFVMMPKVELTSQLKFNKSLMAMGMRRAFEPAEAEFGGMVESTMQGYDNLYRDKNLYVEYMIHNTYVDVEEAGTEAAASAAIMIPPAPHPAWPAPLMFLADHPFLFLIRDNKSGSILFMGRVTNPVE